MRSALIAALLFLSSALQARELPSDEELRAGLGLPYLASELMVNPCVDVDAISPGSATELQTVINFVRADLPPHACDNPDFIIAYTRLFYVQSSLLADGNTPIATAARIDADRRRLEQCRDVACAVQAMRTQFDTYAAEWSILPVLGSPVLRPDLLIDGGEAVPPDIMAAVRPLLSSIVEQCNTNDNDYTEIVWRLRHLTAGGPRVVIAACRTGEEEFPLWMAELTSRGPHLLLSSELGGTCAILPTQRNGHPDLRCSTRLNVSETPKAILTFSGNTYTETLVLDIQSALAVNHTFLTSVPPEDNAPPNSR